MLRDGTTGDWIGTWEGHKGAVWCCRLDATGSLAATASGDFHVKVWDAITGKCLWDYPDAQHIVKSCDFSPNSVYLATGGHEGILRLYALPRAEKAKPREIPQNVKHKIGITKISWWTNEIVLTGCADGSVRFWKIIPWNDTTTVDASPGTPPATLLHTLNTNSGAEVRDMEITTTTTTATAAGGSGGKTKQILTVASGNKVYFFDLQTHTLLQSHTMPIHFREEGGASLHPSGTKFIAGGSDLWVRVFDFETGRELECLKGHHGPIRCLRYSPTGKTYATGSEDGTIRLWKTNPEDDDNEA